MAAPFPPVGPAEAGQKLLRFLQRRLDLPASLLHRWLRTGQIRVNGQRSQPFAPVAAGDAVRVPPFASRLAASGETPEAPGPDSGLPPLLAARDGIWAFAKPAGLAVHPGSGSGENFSDMLACHYAGQYFRPAPAHRLDKETSGILLVGATYKAQRQLQDWFRHGRAHKEYLAWAAGAWPWGEQRLLRHFVGGLDRIEAREQPFARGREALCVVRPVAAGRKQSLLQILLLTGRKRQIRAQLAAMGHPVIGDSRYGSRGGAGLKLHAFRVILPNGREFLWPPPWDGVYAVRTLPDAISP